MPARPKKTAAKKTTAPKAKPAEKSAEVKAPVAEVKVEVKPEAKVAPAAPATSAPVAAEKPEVKKPAAKKAPAKKPAAKKAAAPAKKAAAKKAAPAKKEEPQVEVVKEGRAMNILFASAEAAPFAKTGGLGDVAGSLPKALVEAGCHVVVMLPKYKAIAQEWRAQMEHVGEFYVPLAWRNEWCGLDRLVIDGVEFYFVDNEKYFGRDGYYGHFDDGERFAFFSKAICESIQHLPNFRCDVLHCNDWQTALAPVYLREFYRDLDIYQDIRTVFTVHNVKFQGQFGDQMLNDVLGLGHIPAAASQLAYTGRSINFMKGALLYSDRLTTVSPTYAEELKTPFYGEGMDGIFRARASVLCGILNGIDTVDFNPATDAAITRTYDASTVVEGKAACKAALQEELGLEVNPQRPLIAMVSRLTKQKGLDLVTYALEQLLSRNVQVAVLGTGDREYEDSFRYFDWKYQGSMSARIAFDLGLSKRMYAGADLFMMPSLFEPCGLSQMISMRYGTLPIVRETGGLRDSVIPYNQYTGEGTGFSFANFNGEELIDCTLAACEVFWTNPAAWQQLQQQAMATDVSWTKAAGSYCGLYHDVLGW
jgi:starch synthase